MSYPYTKYPAQRVRSDYSNQASYRFTKDRRYRRLERNRLRRRPRHRQQRPKIYQTIFRQRQQHTNNSHSLRPYLNDIRHRHKQYNTTKLHPIRPRPYEQRKHYPLQPHFPRTPPIKQLLRRFPTKTLYNTLITTTIRPQHNGDLRLYRSPLCRNQTPQPSNRQDRR